MLGKVLAATLCMGLAMGTGGNVEQRAQGELPAAELVTSFDGLGAGFQGPQGTANFRNPSDNSLAVGPDHVFQIVNSRIAIFSKSGTPLYGPVATNTLFRGFDGACADHNNGDAVVRYDQLADRWLVVMPIFTRAPITADEPPAPVPGGPPITSRIGHPGQPGAAESLYVPAPTFAPPPTPPTGPRPNTPREQGSYAMCYAVSTSPSPLGTWYRYEFIRPLFPDYPRPAVWPDGWYVPTSTSDEVIQKQACVVDRNHMLRGEPAGEQCAVIDGVNFLNNADVDGFNPPPVGAPNVMMAAGGAQLKSVMEDSVVLAWTYHVDWNDPSKTQIQGPVRIPVARYHYLCDGQLTNCVPQPGTDRKLDAQGDKIMARMVYRRIGNRESIVAVHSVNTEAGGGGVRWYEFRLDRHRDISVYQQGTYAPDSAFRWMASPAMDGAGNIGIGYSYGGAPRFAGQRFAGRRESDPRGLLSLRETVLAEGDGIQANTLRWEDYSQTAVDPADDCTIWYVGDYLKKDAPSYSSRIGAFRLPGCKPRRRR